jgi:TRAP-type C4-dicarboxylate transport system permease small subunit
VTGASIGGLARLASLIASAVLIYVMLHTLAEITLRTLFSVSTNVVVEFAGYGLAAMTYLALSDAMRSGSLVRVNVLLERMPAGARRALDAFCVLVTLLITLFIAYYFWLDMRRSFVREFYTESILPLPAWLPPIALVVGLAVFAIDLLLHLVLILQGKVRLASSHSE